MVAESDFRRSSDEDALTNMVVRGSTQTPLFPIDFATLQALSGGNGIFGPQFNPARTVAQQPDSFSLDELPDDKREELQRFVEANQDRFDGAVDTPEELRTLMQMLNQGEGRANTFDELKGKGVKADELGNMSAQDMLQLLIDYLSNGGNTNQNQAPSRPRMLGNLNSGGGGGNGGGGGGVSNGGGGGGGGGGGTSSTGGTSSVAPTGAVTAPGSLQGNTNAEKAFNYFVEKGFTKEQAAGIVGNLMQESSVDPNSNQLGGGPGRGIAQWSVGERWAQLEQFASAQGRDPRALETQLDFIMHEFNTTESAAFNAVKAAGSVEEATLAFESKYERAGTPNNSQRIAYANEALETYA